MISVSIMPQQYFLQRIAGDRFEINLLVPPGASPENYEPSSRQIRNLAQSSMYFNLGNVDFERAWMGKIKAVNPEIKVINTATGVNFITGTNHHHSDLNGDQKGVDPHIWMSPKSVKIIAKNMLQAIIEHDPSHVDVYLKNYNEFIYELDSIDKLIQLQTKKLANRSFMIFHPALAYYARDYGLKQLSLEHEGKQPSALRIKELVDVARKGNIKIIMIQKQFDTENAEIIAGEIGAEIRQIDPLGENWLAQIMEITALICR